MANDTLEYTVTETTVTITLTSPVAKTVEMQVKLIMNRVNSAKSMGLRTANIIDLLNSSGHTTEEDIHPETIAALKLGGMRIEAQYTLPMVNLGGPYAAPPRLLGLRVAW